MLDQIAECGRFRHADIFCIKVAEITR